MENKGYAADAKTMKAVFSMVQESTRPSLNRYRKSIPCGKGSFLNDEVK